MTRGRERAAGAAARRRRRIATLGCALAAAVLPVLALAAPTAGSPEPPGPAIPAAHSVIGAPPGMTLIGSSPAEAAGETWGYTVDGGFSLVRYSDEGSAWHVYGTPLNAEGQPLSGFTPAAGPLAGSVTPDGGIAIVGEDAAHVDQVLVRNPGEAGSREAPTLTTEVAGGGAATPNALLAPGETLSAPSGEGVLMAAVEQAGAHTGVLLVPFEGAPAASPPSGVLFYDGSAWAREPICVGLGAGGKPPTGCAAPATGFRVLAIGASSAANAWLLTRTSSESIALFQRQTSGSAAPRWVQRPLGGALGAQLAQAESSLESASHEKIQVHVAALAHGQPLTVTAQGLWVDGQMVIEGSHQPSQSDSFTLYYGIAAGEAQASWCEEPAALAATLRPLCRYEAPTLELPGGPYRSFAWPQGGEYGERVITGLGDGVSLSLRGEAFARVLGIGGESGTSAGAAFASPEEGWLAERERGPLTRLLPSNPGGEPDSNLVQSWPVPFQHPLTAIAEQPGASGGELGAQALAVGDGGQVARYLPGQGWTPEALLNGAGEAQSKVELRGVAWPTANRAFAVGTGGEMWLWRAETGLWEPDPARPPNLYPGNFTGIAFDPSDPLRGYAVGQQGLLLCYGKSWQQEPLPAGLEGAEGANFTSITFAGEEALATYQVPSFKNGPLSYTGGVLVNDGQGGGCGHGGWRVDSEAAQALGQQGVPVRVAGLPDGGAALAVAGALHYEVLERQAPGQPWQQAPAGPLSGYPVALAPFREGATLRTVVSVETEGEQLGRDSNSDEALKEAPPAGQAPVATSPYPLPRSGYVLRETAAGWRDEEHADYPAPDHGIGVALPNGEHGVDWPYLPDAALAFALDPNGGETGWAVGGQTGQINENDGAPNIEAIQTAGVMRYPAVGAVPTGFTAAPVRAGPDTATLAIGGGAQCATACAALAEDDLGPDVWLTNAIRQAGETLQPGGGAGGVRDFLYTGPRLAPGLGLPGGLDAAAFAREQQRYATLLSSAPPPGSSMGVFAAPTEADLDEGSLETFDAQLGPHTPYASGEPLLEKENKRAYAFESSGAGGNVRVIVLDYSAPSLGEDQQCWLARQLALAKEAGAPAIVIGNRGLSAAEPANLAADAAQVIPILLTGAPPLGAECRAFLNEGRAYKTPPSAGASAYFFDAPEQNLYLPISAGGAVLPTFGSGTLGYIENTTRSNYHLIGASGFLLAEVNAAAAVREADNRAPVRVRLVPDISDLALDAGEGVLLRRSRPALFKALARRPHAGLYCGEDLDACAFEPNPYVPIPNLCQGAACAAAIFPEYTFTSSNPDKGQFVEADPASPEGTTVLQGGDGKPIPDEPRYSQGALKGEPIPDGQFEENTKVESVNEAGEPVPRQQSGLFCAYNAGETTVTVKTGGLSYSEKVTIRPGSVEQPCGTVPLRNPPALSQQASVAVPPPAPAPAPAVTPRGTLAPPPAPPPVPLAAPAVLVAHVPHRPAPVPPVPPPAQLYPVVALVPPPAPAAARPTPPSGTAQVPAQSPVSQPVGVAEQEHEEQGAIEIVHHMTAYEHSRPESPLPAWPLGLVLLAAAAGGGIWSPRRQLARAGVAQNDRRLHDVTAKR